MDNLERSIVDKHLLLAKAHLARFESHAQGNKDYYSAKQYQSLIDLIQEIRDDMLEYQRVAEQKKDRPA